MDVFEKQQIIESLKAVLKARTIFVLLAGFQVFTLKAVTTGVSLTSGIVALSLIGIVFIFNILYWFYICRLPEKISFRGLYMAKALQVVFDITMISIMIYLNGTANTFTVSFYLVAILAGSILYRKKGILLITLAISLIYTGLVFLEYYGFFLYQPNPEAVRFFSLENNWILTIRQLIIFNIYAWAAGIYALFLANVHIKRQENLKFQRNELIKQKAELTQTKGWLNAALIKSDKARIELTKAKEELEKVNLELRKKIAELEKFYQVTVGRELKMVQLKKEIKNLQETVKKLESRISKKKSDIV